MNELLNQTLEPLSFLCGTFVGIMAGILIGMMILIWKTK